MSTHNDIFNGLSQFERIKEELNPEFVKIDDRSLPDLLEFVRKYSSLINFIEPEHISNPDRPTEQWNSFFERDNLILLIAISNYKLAETEAKASHFINKIHSVSSESLKSENLNALVVLILEMAKKLDYFCTHLTANEFTQDIVFDLKKVTKTELNEELQKLYAFKNTTNWSDQSERDFSELFFNWNRGKNVKSIKNEILKRESNKLSDLRNIFYTYYYTFYHFVENSSKVLEHMLSSVENAKPHIALLIAFLKLYKFSQDQLNQLSTKHLEFYYRDVLQQSELKAQPDQVLLSVKLKDDIEHYQLPKGSEFLAGENSEQEEIVFATNQDNLLTQAKIMKICTLLHTTDDRYHQKPYNKFSTDSFFSEINRGEADHFDLNNLAPFGEEQIQRSNRNLSMLQSKFGLLVASQALLLNTGERDLEIEFLFEEEGFEKVLEYLEDLSGQRNESLEEVIYKVFSTGFDISFSNAEGLEKAANYEFSLDRNNRSWNFSFHFGIEDKPIETFSGEISRYPKIDRPFVEILLKHECSLYLFDVLNELRPVNIKINSSSRNIKGTQLYNQLGPINSANPFELFGVIPNNGSHFTFGHPEVFSKKVDSISFNIKWDKLPFSIGGMEEYFKEYKHEELESKVEENINTETYQVKPKILNGGQWVNIENKVDKPSLFRNKQERGYEIKGEFSDSSSFLIDLKDTPTRPILNRSTYFLNEEASSGFIRIHLDGPEFAFGHEAHPNILAETLQKNAQPKRKKPQLKLPKTPFSPKVDRISFDYTASTEAVSSNRNRSSAEEILLYEVGPFGYQMKAVKGGQKNDTLLAKPTGQGNLYLGLNEYPYAGQISLLLNINEELEINNIKSPYQIKWYYIKDNEWVSIAPENILSDTTKGLIRSGIIQLTIPDEINKKNTVQDANYFWLKASVPNDVLAHGKLISVYENGVQATWDQKASPIHISKKIPAQQITESKNSIPEIDTIYQPAPSFGGKAKEKNNDFYKRVSERLRHKNRAINLLDYEQLVLHRFSSLYMAKCFTANHTLKEGYKFDRNFFPGSVKLIVVPYLHASVNSSYPRFSTSALQDVAEYLKERTSPFVNLDVTNAHFQKVRVICKAKFKGPETDNYYKSQLENEVKLYLNPWLRDYKKELGFGKSLFKSEVLTFLEQLPYVSFITEFSMLNIKQRDNGYSFYDTAKKQDASKENPNEIKPDFPWSVLVSAQKHDIGIIKDSTYRKPKPRSISNMELGVDFIISEKEKNVTER